MNIPITPEHEELAARLGQAGAEGDAAKCDAIFDEIAETGLECAMAVLCVQTRNLVWMLKLTRGPEEACTLFANTIAEAQLAIDHD